MALLFFDGFDHIGTTVGPSSVAKWVGSGYFRTSTTPTPRTGTHCLEGLYGEDLTTKPLPASGGVVCGVAIQNAGGTFGTEHICRIVEGGTTHLALGVVTGNVLGVYRGGTLIATGTTALSANSWYYVEIKATIHASAGAYEVRIDGAAEAALTASGTNTQNGGTGQWDRINLRSFTGSISAHFDDFYVCDTSGSAGNTFLGAVKVETLFPQTDATAAGSNAGLTPSTGTDHGALVDETAPNTTAYNSAATVGLKDTYNYPAMALSGVILGIQTNLYVQKSDAAARQVCAVVRSGGTDYDGANVSPLTSWAYFTEIRTVNPATAAPWTAAEIAAMEAGMKVTA